MLSKQHSWVEMDGPWSLLPSAPRKGRTSLSNPAMAKLSCCRASQTRTPAQYPRQPPKETPLPSALSPAYDTGMKKNCPLRITGPVLPGFRTPEAPQALQPFLKAKQPTKGSTHICLKKNPLECSWNKD